MTAAPTGPSFVRNPQHLAAIKRLCAERVFKAAGHVTDRVRTVMDAEGQGEHHPGEPRRASLPGEPPVSQSGDLAESQTTRGPVANHNEVIAASGTDEVKSLFLQLGTAYIEPRPYMLAALNDSRRDILQSFSGDGSGGAV